MGAVAQSIGDPTLRFNNATLTTNIGERVRILAESGIFQDIRKNFDRE
jgi:hypothetical protein